MIHDIIIQRNGGVVIWFHVTAACRAADFQHVTVMTQSRHSHVAYNLLDVLYWEETEFHRQKPSFNIWDSFGYVAQYYPWDTSLSTHPIV